MEDELDHSVEEIRGQLTLLYKLILETAGAPVDAVDEAYQALSVLVEEFHQTDLQIKQSYEELLATRQKVEEERANYQQLFEFAPDAYLVTDTQGNILDANQAAAELFNVRRDFLVRKPLTVFVQVKEWMKLMSLERQGKDVIDFELVAQPRGHAPITVSVKMVVVYNAERDPIALRWMIRDITQQKQSQQALAASEARFHTIFKGAEIGMILTDINHVIVEANPAFDRMMGVEPGTLPGKRISSISSPEAHKTENEITQSLLAGHEEHHRAEKRFLRQDGEILWTRMSVSLLRGLDLQPQFLVYMVENISAEKKAAEELAEMKLRLQISGEIERLQLAQELHDGPMQDLYGAVFRLSMVEGKTSTDELWQGIKETQEMLKGVAGTLRTICGELRPPTLENLGLERAIRSHAEKLQERHPEIKIRLELQRDEQELPHETRLALFRIYQHCMMNVMRHAHATEVNIYFQLSDDSIRLSVRDNGKGFHRPSKWLEFVRQGHYGLAGIAERAETLGGKMNLETALDQGTLVQVVVPRQS